MNILQIYIIYGVGESPVTPVNYLKSRVMLSLLFELLSALTTSGLNKP